MVQIKTLSLLPGAKFIVVDDGVEVSRAESLISGWLQMWNEKELGNTVEFLLFASPKIVYEDLADRYKNVELKFHDCYTISVDDVDRNDAAKVDRIVDGHVLQANSVVIVDCLSSLVLSVGLAKALRFVKKLSTKTAQLICVYRRDFGLHRIPRVSNLGTTYLRLDRTSMPSLKLNHIQYEASLSHRKPGGGVLQQRVLISQECNTNTYEIVAERLVPDSKGPELGAPTSHTPEKPLASFRIEMSAREQEQRNSTPLPYSQTNNSAAVNDWQILYQPDSTDDLDEEDPDDDLPF